MDQPEDRDAGRDARRKADNPEQGKYQDEYASSYAVVVGIDRYQDPKLRPLGKAEQDARAIAEVLSGKPYDFRVDLLLGEKATRQAIRRSLSKLRTTIPDDRVIFYFSGHGYLLQDIRGNDIGYLACADTDPEDPFDGLRYAEVVELTNFAQAKHIAFILDACFSGAALGLTRPVIQSAPVKTYLSHNAYEVLTAGAVEVVSDPRSMTGELVKVLRDGLPGQQGALTLKKIGDHVHEVILNVSGGKQSPVYGLLGGSSGRGLMVLMTPKAADQLPEDLRLGLTHADPLTRRFAIAAAEKRLADPSYGNVIRAVLEDMRIYDSDLAVRKQADEALRYVPAVQTPAPAPSIPSQAEEVAPEEDRPPKSQPARTRPKETPKEDLPSPAPPKKRTTRVGSTPTRTTGDTILEVLPAPFEWCKIPAGRVTLADNAGSFDVRQFKMAKYPITYAQFQAFIEAADGYRNDSWWQGLETRETQPGEQQWKIDNHPRENVSWYEAVAFCRWLSKKVGYKVRLPTEWEWQWAAQGPDGRRYPWGNEYTRHLANVDEKGSNIKRGSFLQKTSPVGKYPEGASPYGVLDMAGNVWEWCLNEYGNPSRTRPSADSRRVVRGGSWASYIHLAQAAAREWANPGIRNIFYGFRVVGFGPG